MSILLLFRCQIDRDIDNAVSSIGKVVHYMEYSHIYEIEPFCDVI
jgi:hypothetical protein